MTDRRTGSLYGKNAAFPQADGRKGGGKLKLRKRIGEKRWTETEKRLMMCFLL